MDEGSSKNITREYWQRNIEAFGKFYADISEEEFDSPTWLTFFYKRLILPHEKRLMKVRYERTISFIDRFVKSGMTAVDVGCGTGLFTVEMLRRGARVIAVDYAENALKLTRSMVESSVPDLEGNVEYMLLDVTEKPLPKSDVSIALGVTPYIHNLEAFLANTLTTTERFYCLYLDRRHWANRLRVLLPIFNVRRARFFDSIQVDRILACHHFRLVDREPFATGFLDHVYKL
jgi:SAM-dependent methyltransferase